MQYEKPKLKVYPARYGMKLAHPVGGVLPDTGKRWPDDTFTRRRIADRGIFLTTLAERGVEAPADDSAPAAATETPAEPEANATKE